MRLGVKTGRLTVSATVLLPAVVKVGAVVSGEDRYGVPQNPLTTAAQRRRDVVTWTAEVADDDDTADLTYLWGFDGGLAFRDPGANFVRLNDRSGRFVPGQGWGQGDTMDAALGEVDGDGDLDAYTAEQGPPDRVWLKNASGAFTAGPPVSPLTYGRAVVPGRLR